MAESSPAQTAVIIGQGYVGLPLAQASCAAGLTVRGFEISPQRAAALNSGVSHVDDLSDEDIADMLAAGYQATSDPAVIAEADVVVICVPTPLSEEGGPDLGAVEASARATAEHLTPNTTVVLESTTYPGTTDEVVLPILETSGLTHGTDFLLAYSPERVDPGSKNWTITNTPKLVGGLVPAATDSAVRFYSQFIETVVPVNGTREAETAKLLENTYRHVNIALVNEMARFCHDMDINIWEVIRAASTKPFGFQKFTPGPGVGGHCIPIDPNYLSFQVKKTLGYQFRFVELAQEVNNSMPTYVVTRIADLLNNDRKALNGSKILLLGVTYKPDIADQRESPAVPVADILLQKQAQVSFHDPLVEQWNVGEQTLTCEADLETAVAEADAVVVLQHHQAYDLDTLAEQASILFNTRGAATGAENVHSI